MRAKLLLEVRIRCYFAPLDIPTHRRSFFKLIFLFHDTGKTIADVDMVLLCSGVSPNTSFISPDKLNEKVFLFPLYFLWFWVGTNFLKPTKPLHALLCTGIWPNTFVFRPDKESPMK
jgi:hypothetical protein